MICPNCDNQSLVGPDYGKGRAKALMTCRVCGQRFDAYELFGVGSTKSARKAA